MHTDINTLLSEAQNHLLNRRLKDAHDLFCSVLQHDPKSAPAFMGLGGVLFLCNQPSVASYFFEQVLLLQHSSQARVNLAMIHALSGDVIAAADHAVVASSADDLTPDHHRTLAGVFNVCGDFEKTLPHAEIALASFPEDADLHVTFGLALLATGDRRGWTECEWRHLSPSDVVLREGYGFAEGQRWNGAPVDHLLVCREQGYGDTIQWFRYIPLVAKDVKKLTVVVPSEIAGLLQDSIKLANVEVRSDVPLAEFDAFCWIDSLPGLIGKSAPKCRSYIKGVQADHWREKLKCYTRFRVGLAWAGQSTNKVDQWRSMPVSALHALEHPDIEFFGLQIGGACPPHFIDLSNELMTWRETAGVVANMDLIITVDSALAHLGGAMGKPVWLLNRHNSCWRWTDQQRFGRYPSMRIFSQPSPGDWTSVIDDVSACLAHHCVE